MFYIIQRTKKSSRGSKELNDCLLLIVEATSVDDAVSKVVKKFDISVRIENSKDRARSSGYDEDDDDETRWIIDAEIRPTTKPKIGPKIIPYGATKSQLLRVDGALNYGLDSYTISPFQCPLEVKIIYKKEVVTYAISARDAKAADRWRTKHGEKRYAWSTWQNGTELSRVFLVYLNKGLKTYYRRDGNFGVANKPDGIHISEHGSLFCISKTKANALASHKVYADIISKAKQAFIEAIKPEPESIMKNFILEIFGTES